MDKYKKNKKYWSQYSGLSKEVIEVLKESDRKMEYQQYDIKVERCKIDYIRGTVTYLPSRDERQRR
jgi:hypothetical protein